MDCLNVTDLSIQSEMYYACEPMDCLRQNSTCKMKTASHRQFVNLHTDKPCFNSNHEHHSEFLDGTLKAILKAI